MLVKDGVVKTLNVEGPGKFEVSDADTMLAQAKARADRTATAPGRLTLPELSLHNARLRRERRAPCSWNARCLGSAPNHGAQD